MARAGIALLMRLTGDWALDPVVTAAKGRGWAAERDHTTGNFSSLHYHAAMSIQVEDLSRVLLCAALLLPACGDGDGQAEGEPSLTTTWHDQGAGIKQSEGDLVYGRKVGE